MPPLLDVGDCLLDPDFCDSTLQCQRSKSDMSTGRAVLSTQTIGFAGVVTSDRGENLDRGSVGEHAVGTITVITQFRLRDAGLNVTADVVTWNGASYTVTHIDPYSTYGVGFIQATCELKPLAGFSP
jgi:hypothetical protein